MDTPGENPGLFGKPFDWSQFEDAEPTDELVAAYTAETALPIEQLAQIIAAEQLSFEVETGASIAESNIADLTDYYTARPHIVTVDYTDTEAEGTFPLRFTQPRHPNIQPLRLRVQPDNRQQLFNQSLGATGLQPFDIEAAPDVLQAPSEPLENDPNDGHPAYVYGTISLIAETAINLTLEHTNAEAKAIDGYGATLYVGSVATKECFLVAQSTISRLCTAAGKVGNYTEKANLYTLTAYPTLEAAKKALISVNTDGLAEFKATMGIDMPYVLPKNNRIRTILKRFAGLFLPPPEPN